MLLLLISILIFNFMAFIVPKKLTKLENYTTCLFALVFSGTADLFLDKKYGFYHYFHENVEYIDYISMVGIYPAINIIFLNLFPVHKNCMFKIIYVMVWSLFAIVYEWLAGWTVFFNYNSWKLWYSGMLYPFLYSILLLNLKFIRKLQNK
ncbi:CBO0543 family protein [Heyndrickxia ginsengihumi]|uniref:CBO0543 family protein n=2 Tax=Heyndrickxia ginsengihumi TaxID=363870 RepID=UPI0004711DC3|nr:CBO0543 family protein [Heyndrickxia ginsengihumi]MBE6185538.1 hypothetical protein [Bacillus sp. (in: firmicutes)]